ncbi:MAG: response regulator [Phycisphaerae bacterium]|jgi:CheY-like chemotaxis protein
MSAEAPLILLVDDDIDFLEINRHILEPQGYRVECCTDPEEAWERIHRQPPALLITDLMMSNLDSGFSLSRRVREEPALASLPIIIVTAVSSQCGLDFHPRRPEDLKAMGVDAYFDKPIPPKALVAKVAELLGKADAAS